MDSLFSLLSSSFFASATLKSLCSSLFKHYTISLLSAVPSLVLAELLSSLAGQTCQEVIVKGQNKVSTNTFSEVATWKWKKNCALKALIDITELQIGGTNKVNRLYGFH